MLLSRGASILKNASRLNKVPVNFKQVRFAGGAGDFGYRHFPPPDTWRIVLAEIMGGMMWWWVLWNLYHESDHITGHFPYPRPVEWTDEELGIPPDY